MKIIFVSYNFVSDDLVSAQIDRAGAASMDRCRHDFDKIRLDEKANLIIASIHLGFWSSNVSNKQIDVFKRLFDSGVDIVLGHSSHMPQAIIAREDGKLGFFSLGNFIFRPDYSLPSQALTTIAPKLEIDVQENTTDVMIYPVRINNDGIPRLEEKDNNDILYELVKASNDFSTSIKIDGNLGQMSVNN